MKRRRFIAGLGCAVGVGSVWGSGAVSSVAAERSFTVTTADDNRAFLRLKPLTDKGLNDQPTGRSKSFGTTVRFEIPGTRDGENQNAEGVGTNSIYEFHDLLRVENQGTQSVEIYSEYTGDNLANLALVGDGGPLRNDPPVVSVGDHIDVGLYIDTSGSDIDEHDEILTIIANQPNR